MLEPKSQDAALIRDLYNLIFYFAVIVFILVEGLLIYSAVKFRRRRESEMPEQIHGNNNAELTWTIVPAVIVGLIFGFTVDTMNRLSASGTLANPIAHTHALNDAASERRVKEAEPVDLAIEVTGRQWYWQYKYGDGEVMIDSNSSPLIIPADKNIRLDMVAADVIHAWWVPQFGPMRYVNPGEKSYVWFRVPEGEYKGQCNVFCGVAHANMLSPVKAVPQAEFDKWFAEKAGIANAPLQAGDIERGKQIMFETGPCKACHFIEGTPVQGKVAPRHLTHFTTYPTIAQVEGFTNNPENLTKWLKNPQEVKPGTAMPNNGLSEQQIADLVAYLGTLK
ncbi:MAG: cytochrome c oxidase subunit II [Anaerolineae bacterium]|nr:cytochrome c oxidase subunit II [Anaerolineae bacterium]